MLKSLIMFLAASVFCSLLIFGPNAYRYWRDRNLLDHEQQRWEF